MLLSMTPFKTENNSAFLNVLSSPGFGTLGVNIKHSRSEVLTAEVRGPILRVLLKFMVQTSGLEMNAEFRESVNTKCQKAMDFFHSPLAPPPPPPPLSVTLQNTPKAMEWG